MKPILLAVAISASLGISTAHAQDRDYCPDRPGLNTPACTMADGRTSVEVALGDWVRDSDSGQRSDRWTWGALQLRSGVSDNLEVRLGWAGYGDLRMTDASGMARLSGAGDVTLGVKRNLRLPDGSGFSLALLPTVSLPVGGHAIGAGDWGTSLLMPMSIDLGAMGIAVTPQAAAAVDRDRHGRHLAYGTSAGLTFKPAETLNLAVEAEWIRDEDPQGPSDQALAGLAAGWMTSDTMQLDLGGTVGLNASTPDVELYFGVSRRF